MAHIIFSVYQKELSLEENMANHVNVFTLVSHYNPIHCIGKYDGVQEESILIPYSFAAYESVRSIAAKYNQESILFVDHVEKAYLEYIKDARREYIGSFSEVKPIRALNSKAYTNINGQYYIVK